MRTSVQTIALLLALPWMNLATAEPPSVSYIFPAGGQRGTNVKARIGGHFLHEKAPLEMLGPGVTASPEIVRTETIWFEGPLIRLPASQQKEDYPQDYAADVNIAADASLGERYWRVWNAQGITPAMKFIVGSLPETVEQEIEGEPIPVSVALPLTINGRIFPREDVDVWTFDAVAGQTVTCDVSALELGSPLQARIEVRDPTGREIAESLASADGDPQLRFTAALAGKYEVRIHDAAFGGLQHYVYRLTITDGPWVERLYPLGGRRGSEVKFDVTGQGIANDSLALKLPDVEPGMIAHDADHSGQPLNRLLLDISDLPEQLEAEPNGSRETAAAASLPTVINGRIQSPGDVDVWSLRLAKQQTIKLEARHGRLGSPLLALLVICDETGKDLTRADASSSPAEDVVASFTAPADGIYSLFVGDRFSSRGSPAFAYRIAIDQAKPDFELHAAESVAVDIAGEQKLDVLIRRQGDFKAPITLRVEGLPTGVTAADVQVAPNAAKASLIFKAGEVPVQTALIKVIGRAEIDGKATERIACRAGTPGEAPLEGTRLVTTLKTPFRHKGEFNLTYVQRGTVLRKKFQLERGGYEGPIEVRLADKQGRHLQGVIGKTVTIPPGATEFEYSALLPPWMELARTSRTNLMLIGEMRDAAGKLHKVSHWTVDQNEQLVAIVSPPPLRLGSDRGSFAVSPGKELKIELELKRDKTVNSPVKLELIVPRHMRDIAAEPVTAATGANDAALTIRFGTQPGPLNMPLTIRATADRNGEPVVAELPLELVVSQ